MVVDQTLVIEAEQMQDGGVKIMHRDDLVHRFVAKLVRGAVAESFFYSRPGQPAGEPIGIMIATLPHTTRSVA